MVAVEVVSAAVEEEVIKHDRTVPNSERRMKAFTLSFAILAQASYLRYLVFTAFGVLKGMLIRLESLGSLRIQSRRAMMSSYACTLKIPVIGIANSSDKMYETNECFECSFALRVESPMA